MNRIKVIAQIGYSQTETWIARVYGDAYAVRLEDIPSLPKFGWMPVGTVEFCRAAMAHQGIVEPAPVDYPEALTKWMPYGGHVLCRYADRTSWPTRTNGFAKSRTWVLVNGGSICVRQASSKG